MGELRQQRHSLDQAHDWMRIGECVVNVPLREIQSPSGNPAIRITPKAIGVLLVLVEANGRPVSRDALLKRVWPRTLPTGDVVTQAVVQLRKALADETRAPYITTINGTGYRLIVPAEWLDVKPSLPEFHSRHEGSPLEARTDHVVRCLRPIADATPNSKCPSRRHLFGKLLAIALLATIAYVAIL